jgi:hypothetical protein
MKRPARFRVLGSPTALLLALLIASAALASCSDGVSGGIIGDYSPQWAGGFPKDLPPRPGTLEYDAWKKKQEAEADRDKTKDTPAPKAESPGNAVLPH